MKIKKVTQSIVCDMPFCGNKANFYVARDDNDLVRVYFCEQCLDEISAKYQKNKRGGKV